MHHPAGLTPQARRAIRRATIAALLRKLDADEVAIKAMPYGPERARALAELGRRIGALSAGLERSIEADKDAQRELLKLFPQLAVEDPERAAYLQRRRPMPRVRGQHRSLRPRARARRQRHVARATSSSDPGDSDPHPDPPSSWEAFVADVQAYATEQQIRRERDGGWSA